MQISIFRKKFKDILFGYLNPCLFFDKLGKANQCQIARGQYAA
jgi:hypothetical protein